MSDRLFIVNCPVTHCAPKRVRRNWGATVWMVLTLLALSALAGWLWSCVRHAATAQPWSLGGGGRILAMAPVTEGMVLGLLLSLSAVGIILAVRQARRNEVEAWPPHSDAQVPFEIVDPLANANGQRAPEAMPPSLSRLDAALICFALASEARLIRELVRGANHSLGVEDYGDALAGAEHRLGLLRTRLWQLKAHFDGGLIHGSDVDDLPKTYGANAGGKA